MTLSDFLDRINKAQPLPPVTMYYLGVVTAVAVELDVVPDGLLYDSVLHATDLQKVITRELSERVIKEAEEWAMKKRAAQSEEERV